MEPTAREPTREGRWATPVAGQARHSSALGRMSSSGLAEARSRLRHTFFIAVPPSGRVVKSYVDTLTLLSTFMFAFSAIHVTAVPRRDVTAVPRRRRGSLQDELRDLARLEHGLREQAGRSTNVAKSGGNTGGGGGGGGGGSAARGRDDANGHALVGAPVAEAARAGTLQAGQPSVHDTVYVV